MVARDEERAIGFSASEPVKLEIPSRPEYILLARLIVSGVGRAAGLNADDIYDLKLAVTEAVTNVIRHANVESFEIEYHLMQGAVEVSVTDAGGGFDVESFERGAGTSGGFGLAVIRSLVDELSLNSSGTGTRLRMLRRAAEERTSSAGGDI
ncbi:ATP-binding protein [Rubrobacter taiwanensis]|jgi:serine/threonine-protein kinase RsbW|uniref:ATP-binding protein n=1 Tax=Rubrobacter taiwanensis TaxID=185139 RepID=A0A4R1BFS6_9ACTN|nr:ATP-binding protein [Rubrobacter taiwanensis]TCJ16045.1 ATP-binding protein [Rubrobacter taiwanensis]